MPNEGYILFAVLFVLLMLVVVLLILLLADRKRGRDYSERAERRLADEFERSRRETAQSLNDMNSRLQQMTQGNAEAQSSMSASLNESLNTIRLNNLEQYERMARVFSQTMNQMRESNEKKLDQMRETVDEKLNEFLDTVVTEKENPTSERPENGNPTMARTAKSRPSEPSSESRRARSDVGDPEHGDHGSRPSVKEELRQIRDEQRQKSSEGPSVKTPELEQIPVPVKKKSDKEVTL